MSAVRMSEGEQLDSEEWLQLVRQARQMQTAYEVILSIHGELSVEGISAGIVRSLVELGGLSGAEISLNATFDNLRVVGAAHAGEVQAPESRRHTLELTARGAEVGTLTVHYATEEDKAENEQLIDYVMPTISIGIDNAISFQEVMDYRRTLENRVIERTAQLAEAHAQLEQTVDQLRDAKASRDRFFANINHEIRTPLTLIMLAADGIARSGDAVSAGTLQRLEEVKSSTRRLLHLVNSLLLLAAGDEGKLRIRPGPVDVAASLVRVTQAWQSAAEKGEIEIQYSGPADCAASMDEAALETVVGNFVSNAVKFTPPGGRITVSLAPREDSVTISVRDTGPGIDPEFVPKLFGRFERSSSAVEKGVRGTGIGLSLSKELVDLQGGTIEVLRHEDPRGTSFVVTLPRHQAVTAVLTNEEQHAVVDVTVPPRTPPRGAPIVRVEPEATILLAEDDPGLSAHIAQILSAQYRVLAAPNGKAALEIAREHLPDLLVTDLEMPEMNGIELTKHFLALQGTTLAPVLIVSAHAGLGERLAGFEAGAVDYVLKPFSADELLARIRSQLAIRRLALRLHESQKLAAMGMLSAGLAHELRNPANALVNALQPLLALLPPEERQPDSAGALLAEVAIEAAKQIRERSKNILDYSRAERVRKQSENVAKLFARARRMLAVNLVGIDVRETVAADLSVDCEGPLIEQVLVNLIDNAAYAAGRGGWIELTASRDGAMTVLEVSDSGPGVPAALFDRIFDPFFTTKPVGEGSGLGLAISRRIALNHGGELRVVRRGERTAFRLELPAAAARV
jgi:signal transduction histidine kinase